jgi:hypothetical protein
MFSWRWGRLTVSGMVRARHYLFIVAVAAIVAIVNA